MAVGTKLISFIVPAHNEQSYLGRTLEAIQESANAVGNPYEMIVVDDASTDATAEVARQKGATVVSVSYRQIAATRNAGARAARGERFFFVDADTTITPAVLVSAMRAMDRGAAGGGAPARFDGQVPLYANLLLLWFGFFMRIGGLTGGAFMFCKREAFQAVGGFNEGLFGGEDAAMSLALKQEGPFVVLWRRVVTSGRRVRGLRGPQIFGTLIRMAFQPGMLKDRASVHKVWYESDRAEDETMSSSLAVQASNAVMLFITLLLVAGLLLNVVPRSWTPQGTWRSEIRWAIAMFSCHVALVLWPCAYFLFRSLLRQRRWIERIKFTVLIALCLFFAWGGTYEVILFWKWVGEWLFGMVQ